MRAAGKISRNYAVAQQWNKWGSATIDPKTLVCNKKIALLAIEKYQADFRYARIFRQYVPIFHIRRG